jgi:hypothetical protein
VNSSLAAFEHYLMQQPGLTAIPVLEGSFPVGYLVPDDHDGLVAGGSVAELLRTNLVVLQAHDEIEDLDRAMERPGVVCVVWDGIFQGIVPELHWKDRFTT